MGNHVKETAQCYCLLSGQLSCFIVYMSNPEPQPDTYPDQALPAVSFDLALGRQYDQIDFDYTAYMAHLRSNGMTDGQIAGTDIRFHPKRGFIDNQGLQVGNKIDVWMDGQANAVLVHETQHRIDRLAGLMDKNPTRPIDFKKVFTISCFGLAAVSIGLVGEDALRVSHAPLEDYIGIWAIQASGAAGTAYALYRALAYQLNIVEKRAFHAQATVKTPFLTFSERT